MNSRSRIMSHQGTSNVGAQSSRKAPSAQERQDTLERKLDAIIDGMGAMSTKLGQLESKITTVESRLTEQSTDTEPQRTSGRQPSENGSDDSISDAYRRRKERERLYVHTNSPVKPPKFEGKRENAASWLIEYKNVAELNEWSQTVMIRQLLSTLSGSAKEWYKGVWGRADRPQNWTEFEKQFQEAFLPEELEGALMEKIYNLKQGRDQDLLEYVHNAMGLCSLSEDSDSKKIYFIMKGMKNEERKFVAAVGVKTLSDLNAAVHRWYKAGWNDVHRQILVRPTNNTPPQNINRGNNDYNRVPYQQQHQQQRRRDDNECYRCGQKGHHIHECRVPQHTIDKRKEERGNQVRGPQPVIMRPTNKPQQIRNVYPKEETPQEEYDGYYQDEQMMQDNPDYPMYTEPPNRGEDEPDMSNQSVRTIKINTAISPSSDFTMIECTINGCKTNACIDSGAATTICSIDFINKSKTDIYRYKGPNLSMADGTLNTPLGWCILKIEFLGRVYQANAIVLKKAPELLLGLDYQRAAGIIISAKHKTVTYEDLFAKNYTHKQEKIDIVSTIEPQVAHIKRDNENSQLYIEYIQAENIQHPTTIQVSTVNVNNNSSYLDKKITVSEAVTIPPYSKGRIQVKVKGIDHDNEEL